MLGCGPIGFAVSGDHALVDGPGDLDLGVFVGVEQGLQAGPLSVGEKTDAGVEGASA